MQADVFSLGCVIAEVLGKQLASSEIITTGTTAEYYRWAQRCVLNSLLQEVVGCMLRFKPPVQFSSAGSVSAASTLSGEVLISCLHTCV